MTESGQFVETLDYVAPEQIENKEVSAATDVYALGCVLFECLTGQPPFGGDSKIALLWAHMEGERPRASERILELPSEVDEGHRERDGEGAGGALRELQ